MSTSQVTPASLGAQMAAAFSAYFAAQNALAVASYNSAVVKAVSFGVAPPAPPMMTAVNTDLIIQLEEQSAAAPNSVTAAQWAQITAQVQYVPVTAPPVPASPVKYTIGAAEPTLPGFYAVSSSTNQPIVDATVIDASNMTDPDGHTYVAHTFGFAGSVAAQRRS